MIQNKIRRKDRAITDYQQMLKIMQQCDVCRLGLIDGKGVYIVPLNFAFKSEGNKLILYFHSLVKGKKIDLIRQQNIVGFEMDRKHELVHADIACHYSFTYQSIIGKGKIAIIEEAKEKVAALQCIMQHYTQRSDWAFDENELKKVATIKLEVTEWACKEH